MVLLCLQVTDFVPQPTDLLAVGRTHEEAMETAIERCLGMDDTATERMGESARAWYESNNADFPKRLLSALHP